MATFTAVKNRGGGRGTLGGVLRYTQQDEKTLWEGLRLVSGWNCTAQSALSEMQLTKERYRKTDGRQYYHFVQSFAETDDLTPQGAHAIALELAQREFPNFEVLVATHIDTDHMSIFSQCPPGDTDGAAFSKVLEEICIKRSAKYLKGNMGLFTRFSDEFYLTLYPWRLKAKVTDNHRVINRNFGERDRPP